MNGGRVPAVAETLTCGHFAGGRGFMYMMAGRMMHGGGVAMTVS